MRSVVTFLFFVVLLLGSPDQITASTLAKSVADPKYLKVNKREAARVDRILGELVVEIFEKGKIVEFLERHLTIATRKEREAFDEAQHIFLSEEDSTGIDQRTLSRRFAASWSYAQFPFVLMARTVPQQSREFCPDCCDRHDEANRLIEHERERLLKTYGLRPNDFYQMLADKDGTDRVAAEKSLTTLEKLNSDLFRFLVSQTKRRTFATNLQVMKRDRRMVKVKLTNEIVYEAVFKPVFRVVFATRGGQLKIIALGDLYDPC